MKKKTNVDTVERNLQPTPYDYTVIEQGLDGNIGVALHAWDPSKGRHKSVSMTLEPDEALLFARMLVRHVNEAKDNAEVVLAAVG